MSPKLPKGTAGSVRGRGEASFINLDANSMTKKHEQRNRKVEKQRQVSHVQDWYTIEVSTTEKGNIPKY